MTDMAIGAAAGFAATAPMTWAMEAMHRQLPPEEQDPLHPRKITERVAERAGVNEHLDESDRFWLTVASHFGYGAAAGSLYPSVSKALPLPPVAAGAAYGLAVWAGSYLGLLPALGIMRPATEHPPRRTGLTIAAHLVWGAALGLFTESLEAARRSGGLQSFRRPEVGRAPGDGASSYRAASTVKA